MAISPEQARIELARRELARRGIDPSNQPAPEPRKSLVRRAAEAVVDSPTIPIAAGVGAGLASAPFTGPAAVAIAGTVGAGAEGYRQLLARGMGLDTPQTAGEAAKKMAIEGGAQALGEGGGRAIGYGLKTPLGRRAVSAAGETLARAGEMFTNIPAKDLARIVAEPSAFLNPFRMGAAREGLAAERAGIGVSKELTEEAIQQMGATQDDALKVASRVLAGGDVTPLEAYNAIETIGKTMPTKTRENAGFLRRLSQAREVLSNHLQNTVPAERAATREYAIAQAGDKAHSLLPRSNSGKYLLLRSGFMLGGGLGGYKAGGGDWRSTALGALALSPLGIGTGAASLGLARQAAPALIRGGLGFGSEKALKTRFEDQ